MTESKEKKKPRIDRTWCKGCGICAAFCPKNVLEINDTEKAVVARPEDCISCGMCEMRCPDFAVLLTEEGAAHGQ